MTGLRFENIWSVRIRPFRCISN